MEGKIIEEFKIGNTIVRINDAYMRTGEVEIERILKNIAEIVMNAHNNKQEVNYE